MEIVNLGGVLVGEGQPAVFMPELGTFFNQDVEQARRYIKQCVDVGARIIKSEVLHDAGVCLPNSGLVHKYKHAGGTAEEDYRALMERKTLSLDQYRRIYGYCRELEVPFVASVYDITGIDFLVEMGAAGIKISRDKIDNTALIRSSAQTGLPVVIDAGEVPLDETARAVRLAREAGAGGVIINHHPGGEPAAAERHNLNIIRAYKNLFGLPVGLSCHYRGNEIMYAAVGAGVDLVEKGVADDPDSQEQAIIAAAPVSELKSIIDRFNDCWQALGTGQAQQTRTKNFDTRQCLVVSRRVVKGEAFGLDNLSFAFPPVGISAADWDQVAGRRAIRNLDPGTILAWSDVTPSDEGAR